ncbi:MAG: hypothetical protein ACSLFP_09220, partial [Acidimicrobiales bacterium]
EGELRVGQDGPFLVDGEEEPLRHDLRYDNPWAQVPFQSATYELTGASSGLVLDFAAGTRTATADPASP